MADTSFFSFTAGEISKDAWDRVDIQPVSKGCEEATNYVIRIAGPLGKRRGFWRIAAVQDETKGARMIPFRRSIDDALMLEFGHLAVRVWQANGAPLLNTGVQVNFASPYTAAQLPGLRFKQVADVIYFRHATGLAPYTLVRQADSSWAFHAETFPNGPWLPENADLAKSIGVTVATATSEADTNASTGAGTILADGTVTLTAGGGYTFDPGQVGAYIRLRQNTGTTGVKTWSTGFRPAVGNYCASAGHVYTCTTPGGGPLTSGVDQSVTTPPVQTSGAQSDGGNLWTYRHDGAGVVQIIAYNNPTNVTAQVIAPIPFPSGVATRCFSEGAYSTYRGWPRMWPSIVEERLVDGATASNLDMLDFTETAGFDQTSESFTPGLGDGTVVDTDAMRRRVGDDGAQILWSLVSTWLLIGTASGEYIASGGLFGTPLSPSSIVVRPLSDYGSEDVYPVRAHKGLIHVTRGGQGVREMQVDLQQTVQGDDLSFLAAHIAKRLFKQLAWVPYPDEVMWARLGDGGLAAMTYHREQQVRGWTRQQIPGGFIVEDIATLPGPGRLETLWMVVSRTKGGVTQRHIWMQSQPSDRLFIDGAELYSGAPATVIAGLGHYEGETARVLADGVMYDLPVSGGAVTLSTAASVVQAGLGYKTRLKSLKIDAAALAQALNLTQRPTQVVVHLDTSAADIGVADGAAAAPVKERVSSRTAQNVPAAASQETLTKVGVALGSSRDPRITVEEDTAYDMVIYGFRPTVAIGG